ncbi:MAG: complex I subunit 4 family protein [Candidatus Heimdallarchaeaceae archaeon]
MIGILTTLITVPLIGAIIVFLIGTKNKKLSRLLAQFITFAELSISWSLFAFYDRINKKLNIEDEFVRWIDSFSIHFSLSIDGISFVLVLLSTTIVFLVALQSTFIIEENEHLYYTLLLLFETGILGVFLASNLIIFYIFWELVLVPMFFLIGEWGGERKRYAAVKFFIFTHVGSLFMLLSFLYLFINMKTFSIIELSQKDIPEIVQTIAAIGIFLGVAVKLPAVPIHSWLPDAHVEAPSPVSVLLAGLLLKMAGYGFLKLGLNIVPEGIKVLRPVLITLGVVGAFYAAFAAIAQKDLKRVIAFTSINHMSFIMIAVAVATPLAIIGAVFQMISHGIIIGLMFFLSGIIQHHVGTREINLLGGIKKKPVLAGFLIVGSIAAFGAPPMSGFIAEMMIFFASIPVYPWVMTVAAFSIVITSVIYLWLLTRVLFTNKAEEVVFEDLVSHQNYLKYELSIVGLLFIPIFVLGFFPNLLVSIIEQAVNQLLKIIG